MYCQSSSIRKARSNVLSERFSSERNARLRFPYIGSTPTFYISICTQERCLLDGIYSPRQIAYCNSQNETRAVVNKHVCHIEIRRSFCGQWTYIAKGKLSWAVRAFKWSRLWQHARFSGHFLFTESTLLSVVILSPPKPRHMRAVLPCIDAALNQTWKVQAVFFKLNYSWQFPFKSHPWFIVPTDD